jgi:hypothetical protein
MQNSSQEKLSNIQPGFPEVEMQVGNIGSEVA